MKVPMTDGFTLIPEGEYIFRIYDVKEDDDFGKVDIKLVTAKGLTHKKTFSLKDKDNEWIEGALNAFSFFAKSALNDFSREDIDTSDLIDCYIKADVTHTDPQPNKNDPSKTVVFANLNNFAPADGFDEEPTEKALTLGKNRKPSESKPSPKPSKPVETKTAKKGLDLDSLLG